MVKFVIFLVLVAATTATPLPELHWEQRASMRENEHLRFPRVTCDLLSMLGHAACAAHCLSMGQAGGHCESGICICRRDTFKDVWDAKKDWMNKGREAAKQKVRDDVERWRHRT